MKQHPQQQGESASGTPAKRTRRRSAAKPADPVLDAASSGGRPAAGPGRRVKETP